MARTKKTEPSIETTDEFLDGYKARQLGKPEQPPFCEEQAKECRRWLAGWKQRDAEEQPREKGEHGNNPLEWAEGYDAHVAGEDAACCPYGVGSPKAGVWMAGWQHHADQSKPAAEQQVEYTLSDKDRVAGLNARGVAITLDQWRLLPAPALRMASKWLDDAIAGKTTQLPVCLLEFFAQHKADIDKEISAADPIEIPVQFGTFSSPGDSLSIGLKIKKSVADHGGMERHFCGKRLKCVLSPVDDQQQLPGMEEMIGEVAGIFESKSYGVKPRLFTATLNAKGEERIGEGLLHLSGKEGVLRILEVGSIPDKTDKANKPAKNPPPPKRGGKKSAKNEADAPRQKSLESVGAPVDGRPQPAATKSAKASGLRWHCEACETDLALPEGQVDDVVCPQCGKTGGQVVGYHNESRADADGDLYVLHNEQFATNVRKEANYRLLLDVVKRDNGKWVTGYLAEWKEPGLDGWQREQVAPNVRDVGRASQADAIAAVVGQQIDKLSFGVEGAPAVEDLKVYLAAIERGTHPSALEPADDSDDDEVAA